MPPSPAAVSAKGSERVAQSVREVLLWLFVVNQGIALGAGLYEIRMVVTPWIASLRRGEDARMPDSGRQFWAFVTTMPLTLLTLASVVAARQTPGAKGAWWLAAAALVLVERVMTFGYFIPTMLRLQRDQVRAGELTAAAKRWVTLNYARATISLAAWLATLCAFSRQGRL